MGPAAGWTLGMALSGVTLLTEQTPCDDMYNTPVQEGGDGRGRQAGGGLTDGKSTLPHLQLLNAVRSPLPNHLLPLNNGPHERPTGPAAHLQLPHAAAVELAHGGEHHPPDVQVEAHADGVAGAQHAGRAGGRRGRRRSGGGGRAVAAAVTPAAEP